MKTWMVGVMVGVLAAGGAAIWLAGAGHEDEAPRDAALAPSGDAAPGTPRFDRPLGDAPLAEPKPLAPVSGDPGEPEAARDANAAAAGEVPPDGEDVVFTGRVVDGAFRPVEGALVLYVAEPMRVQMQAREDRAVLDELPVAKTGRDGRFELPARAPLEDDSSDGFPFGMQSQQLVVRHEAFATLAQPLGSVAGPAHDTGDLVLEPGAWISGRAVDSNGRPVSGAQARAANEGGRRDGPGGFLPFVGRNLIETVETAVTGADGRFTVRGLSPGAAELTLGKTGLRAAAREDLELPAHAGLDVGDVTLEKGASIAGVVLDESGAPLAGADVSVSSMSRLVLNRLEELPRQQMRQEFGQRARTDESGRFELAGLAGGNYTVHANAEGYDALSKADVPAGTRDLRLEPVPLGGLLVRLTSADGGAPIEGAEIRATPKRTESFGFAMRQRSPAAEVLAGAAALSAAGREGDPRGVYFVPHAGLEGTELVVAAEGFATTALESPAAPSGGVTEHDAQLAPESVVAGLVSDPAGKPVARARLTLRSAEDDDESGFQVGGRGRDREIRRSIRLGDDDGPSASRHSAVTGVDGRFELAGVAAGEWELSARARGFVRGEPQALTLETGKSQSDLRVILEPAGSIAGLVTEPDGTAVPGAEVFVEPLSVRPPPAAEDDGFGGQLARLGDLAGAGPDRRRARTDVKGEYRVGDLAPGDYTVRLNEGGRGGMFGGGGMVFAIEGDQPAAAPGTPAKVEAGRETRLDFQRPERARLTGRVLAGGLPAPDVTVRLRPAGDFPFFGGGRTESTDSRGQYSFDEVTAGAYEVSALVPGAAVEKQLPVELQAGEARSADLVFGGSTVSGRVVQEGSDSPAAGVDITVVPVVESEGGETQMEFAMIVMDGGGGSSGSSITIGGGPAKAVRSGEDGRFEVRYLEPGQYRIEASGQGYVRTAPQQVEVKDGENRDEVVLQVQRGAVLAGVVRDSATGQRLDKVPVRLEGEGTTEMTVTADGAYRFEGLGPGAYAVSVMGSGFLADPLAEEQITLETGQQATLDLKTKESSQ